MKILVIGGTGTIGKPLAEALQKKHQLIIAGKSSGDLQLDLSDSASLQAAYAQTGPLDAVVCVAGEAKWGKLKDLSEADFQIGIQNKLMGQINLVRLGLAILKPQGSFTLSSGILADHPVDQTTSAALVNGALHSFVKAAALEMDQDRRINVVSLNLVQPSQQKYQDYFPGSDAIPISKAINGYIRSIMGKTNGKIIRVYS